jgi:hypothetical protein
MMDGIAGLFILYKQIKKNILGERQTEREKEKISNRIKLLKKKIYIYFIKIYIVEKIREEKD